MASAALLAVQTLQETQPAPSRPFLSPPECLWTGRNGAPNGRGPLRLPRTAKPDVQESHRTR